MDSPVILVDVDGVLNPDFTSRQRSRAVYTAACGLPACISCGWVQRRVWVNGHRLRLVVQPGHGKLLRDLAQDTGAELAWGTCWNGWANTYVSPLLGLPELPVATCVWYESHDGGYKDRKPAVDWTDGRPFVWLDDAKDTAEHVGKITAGSNQRHHVVQVNNRAGLQAEDIEEARQWLHSL